LEVQRREFDEFQDEREELPEFEMDREQLKEKLIHFD